MKRPCAGKILISCFFLLAAVSRAPGLYASEETEVAARMSEDVSVLLDQLIGAGRARIFITVEGEKNSVNTQTEVTTPIPSTGTEQGITGFPGYLTSRYLERTYQLQKGIERDSKFIQKEQEQSSHTTGFNIKRITASLVLDRRIPEVQASAVRLVISDLLRLESRRGDSLVIIRADMVPLWKSAFFTPEGYRTMFGVGALLAILLLVFVLAYFLAAKLLRGIIEYAHSRRAETQSPAPMTGQPQAGMNISLSENDMPGVFDAEISTRSPQRLLDSEVRFGFLNDFPQKEAGQFLDAEPVEDLALLIAYLADKGPHLASKLLLMFPIEKRGEITKAMVSINEADPERLAEIENRLKTRIEMSLKGTDKLGKLLSVMEPGDRSNILGDLSASDPEGSARVAQSLITFEDICRLSPENLRPVVNSIPYQDWGIALRGAPREQTAGVLEIFPAEIRQIVEDVISSPQKKDKIIESRSSIIAAATGLALKGMISLGEGTHSPEVI